MPPPNSVFLGLAAAAASRTALWAAVGLLSFKVIMRKRGSGLSSEEEAVPGPDPAGAGASFHERSTVGVRLRLKPLTKPEKGILTSCIQNCSPALTRVEPGTLSLERSSGVVLRLLYRTLV